ncbi:MAG: hypothetical protein IJF07_09750 [Lachnospiraceae bacterium]|nr:hypothetical protein [Lachnospiraceae bacterium]
MPRATSDLTKAIKIQDIAACDEILGERPELIYYLDVNSKAVFTNLSYRGITNGTNHA